MEEISFRIDEIRLDEKIAIQADKTYSSQLIDLKRHNKSKIQIGVR